MFFVIFTFLPIKSVFSDSIEISNINISEIKDGRATLRWTTNINTKAEIYYGESTDVLDRFMGYSLYDQSHESVLSGLEQDEKYYFKIISIDIFGNRVESFIQSFNTDDMIDTTIPVIEKFEVVGAIWDSVLLHWQTNEKVKTEFFYGNSATNLNKKATDSTYSKNNYLYVSKLYSNSTYYIQIKVKDKGGNYQVGPTITFSTSSKPDSANQTIKFITLEPSSNSSSLISTRSATMKIRTNWTSRAIVYYGTKSNSLNKKQENSVFNTEHIITINNLEPNKDYYFKVKVYDSFHDKSKTSAVFQFKTKKLDTTLKTGDLIKDPNSSQIYIIQGNNKAWIENENIFTTLGYKWNWVREVDGGTFATFKETPNISNTRRHPDGTLIKYDDSPAVYVIENKKKRPFLTAQAFERAGYIWDQIITIDKKKWSYQTGDNIY